MWKWVLLALTIVVLAGCNDDDKGVALAGGSTGTSDNGNSESPTDPSDPAEPSTPDDGENGGTALDRFSLANRCVALMSVATDSFVERTGSDDYTVNAEGASDATLFHFKPTDLGKYMLYADDQTLLDVSSNDPTGATTGYTGFHLGSVDAPRGQPSWKVNHGVIWEVDEDEGGFHLASQEHDPQNGSHILTVSDNGTLIVASRAEDDTQRQRFEMVPAENCAEFPEISTDTQGETFKGNGVDKPVVGFADVHSHISATGFLGDGHLGRPFSQYGVALALPDGTREHGPTGFFDLIGNIYGGNPFDFHDIKGWPTFADWPGNERLLTENAYYKWVKRSYKAGLRLTVNNLVQNDVLCALNKTLQVANPGDPDLLRKVKNVVTGLHGLTSIPDGLLDGIIDDALNGIVAPELETESCDDMKTAVRQAAYMYRMQKYIDAQNGGKGEGWFRIVKSPKAAREVINDGKLAVVLGLEVSNVFGCKTTMIQGPLGTTLVDKPQCSKEEIQSDLDHLHKLGVRQINLMHEFNNALGGNGIFNGNIINVGNFLDTGAFWRVEPCPDTDYFYDPDIGSVLLSLDPISYLGGNPISMLLELLLQGTLPVYPDPVNNPRQCNKRGITDLGRFALAEVMGKHMMVDVDHMSVKMKGQVIDEVLAQEPVYPVVSTHGGHGGVTLQQAKDILKSGGLINPIDVTPEAYMVRLEKLEAITPDDDLLAMSYTSDVNGLAAQPGPSEPKIDYPFTLFQGADWGPKFDDMAPVTFDQSHVPEGDRYFDYNDEGIAHYGLYADWVEALRKTGGARAMNALYNSAEHYLRVWERAEDR